MNRSKRILLVDDEDFMRSYLANFLRRDNYIVIEASSGNEAINLVQTEKYDLVISDVRMPCGSGISLLNAVRSNHPLNTKFIFMTGYSDIFDDRISKMIDGYIEKPFRASALLNMVGKMFHEELSVESAI